MNTLPPSDPYHLQRADVLSCITGSAERWRIVTRSLRSRTLKLVTQTASRQASLSIAAGLRGSCWRGKKVGTGLHRIANNTTAKQNQVDAGRRSRPSSCFQLHSDAISLLARIAPSFRDALPRQAGLYKHLTSSTFHVPHQFLKHYTRSLYSPNIFH